MRVNPAFTNYFTHRLVVRSGIPSRWLSGAIGIVMLAIFITGSSFANRSDRDIRAKQTNIIVREIGHRLLLQAGDLTSRVLPVTEIKEGTFLLTFENEFVFNHDSLMMLTQSLFPKTHFPSGYTVAVHECVTAIIVYGFQINNTSPDILACRGRRQPQGCYTIEIAFPDLYEHVEQKKADIDQRTDELKSVKVDPQESNSIPIAIGSEEFKATIFGYPLINLVNSGMLVLLGVGVTLLIGRFGKSLTAVPVHNQNHAVLKESVPEWSALGKFLFDVKSQRLLLGSEVISLTDKECKILELLNKSFGALIPRETLMQEVWINEGVITGRSLDMFVSKLRKKLNGDPELRITNVHGKGYKLEIPGVQVL